MSIFQLMIFKTVQTDASRHIRPKYASINIPCTRSFGIAFKSSKVKFYEFRIFDTHSAKMSVALLHKDSER